MAATASSTQPTVDALARALRDRFPSAVGGAARSTTPLPALPTRVDGLDALLPGGGLPGGRLSLLSGSTSSGRTSLALAAVAATQERGERVVWIDGGGVFHAPSAARAGVALDRMLLVRVPPAAAGPEGVHAATLLARSGAVALVVLDLAERAPGTASAGRRGPRWDGAALRRLARAIPGRSACLLLAEAVPEGSALASAASVSVRLAPEGRPEALDEGGHRDTHRRVRATLARSRLGGEGRSTVLRLRKRLG